jgi:hypothetical protein
MRRSSYMVASGTSPDYAKVAIEPVQRFANGLIGRQVVTSVVHHTSFLVGGRAQQIEERL